MKNFGTVRYGTSLLLIICLLSPIAALAGDGKKHFKAGMDAEIAEQWDKAVESFALAVAESPKNAEYKLHYTRALFNASQMYMKRGNTLVEEKDYAGAYNAFRRAYAYDPVNELARAQMEKMLRLQEGVELEKSQTSNPNLKLVPTSYQTQPQDVFPQRLEKLRDVPFPSGVDLQFLIKELAKDLDLNVLFDNESRLETRKVKIELKGVTAAKALDYLFLQENLFFQKVGPRTIIVATSNRRQNYQQLVLRTFYLANANPEDVKNVIQSAIPVQPGRQQPIPLVDKATNSITIRDTAENIAIIGRLLRSLDKDRAEVVMDVNIYEVTKQDMLKLGNQIGSESSLSNLGGTSAGALNIGTESALKNLTKLPLAIGTGILLPQSTISAFQRKNNVRLLASTQVHAFNNEKSTAKIGQRVPVKSATYLNTFNNNPNNNNGFSPAADVITYEQTGLTLEFEPLIFPNQDVQVKMSITSRDIGAESGVNGNPIFGEREIKGSARIQNNRTLLLASVAQNKEERGRAGLPLLGLIPVLGRFFATPTRNDSQSDIVIAVTPRVLRAPVILPEDEIERPTGSVATPTTNSLEAMVIQEEREEQLANARRLGNTANVQLPPATEMPQYVRSDGTRQEYYEEEEERKEERKQEIAVSPTQPKQNTGGQPVETKPMSESTIVAKTETPSLLNLAKPIDSSVKTLQIMQTGEVRARRVGSTTATTSSAATTTTTAPKTESGLPKAEMFLTDLGEMKAGEKTRMAVFIKSGAPFGFAVVGLKFDPAKVAVRSVQAGEIFGAEMSRKNISPFLNTNGKMYVSLSNEKETGVSGSGILAYVEIEALSAGKPQIALDTEILNVLTTEGRNFELKY